ncbi:hypothetical protein CBR_g34837 [Chara braunii]|uniref:Uncharacterized protein n=1 Tax=Chara braunii TaxID=69332 RepID=A0A388LJN4_CHABU|nr:hypothetical protein CBR_g34837 [Chara braunii]|eukprot:GBG82461.1 hypothetical protein CBR_g34837 [Chara braunii]
MEGSRDRGRGGDRGVGGGTQRSGRRSGKGGRKQVGEGRSADRGRQREVGVGTWSREVRGGRGVRMGREVLGGGSDSVQRGKSRWEVGSGEGGWGVEVGGGKSGQGSRDREVGAGKGRRGRGAGVRADSQSEVSVREGGDKPLWGNPSSTGYHRRRWGRTEGGCRRSPWVGRGTRWMRADACLWRTYGEEGRGRKRRWVGRRGRRGSRDEEMGSEREVEIGRQRWGSIGGSGEKEAGMGREIAGGRPGEGGQRRDSGSRERGGDRWREAGIGGEVGIGK